MNDLGMMLAWVAVQVSIVAIPCLAAHALASRRGPSSGAWVATLSLGLVVLLNICGPISLAGREDGPDAELASQRPPALAKTSDDPGGPDRAVDLNERRDAVDFAALRRAWVRFGRGAAAPVERCRPWGDLLTCIALAGAGVSLLRLIAGLWAIRACRRRGRVVGDLGMNGLFAGLRRAMGVARTVELCETAELSTPATAGWLRPMVLLPADWRSWDESERRAVLAHELAHIARGDYAVGLLARLALALNYYHPLVRWVAGRLQLQQEQAADALGARFAGGRSSYLVALSRMALRQDGRLPCGPARAFLPGRGALIRRIAMLNDRDGSRASDRPLTTSCRVITLCGLLAVTFGVATLRGPARAADAPAVKDPTSLPPTTASCIEPPYLRSDMQGLVAFRPAAFSRRVGFGLANLLVLNTVGADIAELAKELKIDTSRPGFLKLEWQDVEWVSCGLGFGRANAKNAEGQELHSLLLSGLTVRATAPYDWLTFLRQWRLDPVEARAGGHVYYKITGPPKAFSPDSCVYLLDDRTAVFDREKDIRALAEGRSPRLPAYLRGQDWERASRGLLAVAIDNRDDTFAKMYDMGRPDDAVTLSLFKGVDHWILGVADADSIGLRAAAACLSDDAGAAVAAAILPLLKLGQEALEHPEPEAIATVADQRMHRMTAALLKNLGVRNKGREVEIRAEGFGTLAEFASIIESEAKDAGPRKPGAKENTEVRGK